MRRQAKQAGEVYPVCLQQQQRPAEEPHDWQHSP